MDFNFSNFIIKKMKPGLAVLPMEVWADVFDSPLITRQWLAQFANNIRNRKFAEKLQKYLHDPKCGKHTLRYLDIYSKPPPKCPASLAVASHAYRYYGSKRIAPIYEDCEFPESALPENITAFKRLEIRHFDDQVLDFLSKIKPILNNVYLSIGSIKSESNLRILFGHLLPMLASIRGIACNRDCVEFFQQHFPGTLARAKELDLEFLDNPAHIHTYLNWLNSPQDFDLDGPRFLRISAFTDTIIAMVEAVRKHFLAANSQSTPFVLFIRYCDAYRAGEFKLENAVNEQLTVRNACFKTPVEGKYIHYAEILRHPMGADAKLREWIKGRAYFEKTYKNAGGDNDGGGQYQETEQLISTGWPSLTMGRFTKKKCADSAMDQDEEQPASNEDAAGPSTSAKKMKK